MSRCRSQGDQRPATHLSINRRHGSAWRRALLSATAFSAVFAAAGSALADFGTVTITDLTAPQIVVESDGSTYADVSSPDVAIEGNARVVVDAEISGRVLKWRSQLRLKMQSGQMMDFPYSGAARHYTKNPRPKRIEVDHRVSISKWRYRTTMAAACIQNAERLRAQGWSNDQIFSQDHQVEVLVLGRLDYETTGIAAEVPPEVGPTPPSVNVTCRMPDPQRTPLEAGPTRIPSEVTSVDLDLLAHANNRGACTLRVQGRIGTSSPNEEVTFRYADDAGRQSDVKTVSTNAERTVNFHHDYQLPGGNNSGQIRIVGVSSGFQSDWQDYELNCMPGGFTAEQPPKADSVSYQVESETEFRGLFCPEVITVAGIAKGRGEASGRALLSVGNRPLQMFDYAFEDTERDIFKATYNLSWDNVQQARQPLRIAMQLRNNGGDLVDEIAQDFTVICRSMPWNSGGGQAVGGLAVEQREELAQQGIGGRLAQPVGGANAQVAGLGDAATAGFDIQAPEGRVRKGVIRLSGGQATANYALRFFRRTDSGLQHVRSAQLPQRMTGNTANFDLRPLAGSRAWRLEVCQIGSTGISSTASCETSDFSLGRLGGAQSGAEPSAEPVKRTRRIMQRNAN